MATKSRLSTAEETSPQSARIFIVEDHELVRRGLTVLLESEADLQICGEAGDSVEARRAIDRLRPDLALVDLVLQDGKSFGLISDLRTRLPDLKILVFSMHREPAFICRAFQAGADDYVLKDEGSEKVVLAVRNLLREPRDSALFDPRYSS